MGRRRTTPVVTVGQLWNALEADYGVAGSYGLAIEDIITAIESGVYGLEALDNTLDGMIAALAQRRLNFYDEFNRTAEDTDVWTSGGDDGSFTTAGEADRPTFWTITTGATTDNDRYIHGGANILNKWFTPHEDEYTTITWEARLRIILVTDISAFWGLVGTAVIDYVEPNFDSATFFADPAITNTFRARTRDVAEEETDTLVALDTDYHTFRIVWTAASVLFYIDDVLVATHETQVPDAVMFIEFLIRTEADAAKYLRVDYVHVEVT